MIIPRQWRILLEQVRAGCTSKCRTNLFMVHSPARCLYLVTHCHSTGINLCHHFLSSEFASSRYPPVGTDYVSVNRVSTTCGVRRQDSRANNPNLQTQLRHPLQGYYALHQHLKCSIQYSPVLNLTRKGNLPPNNQIIFL